jgi:hypothetical protein
MGTRHRIGASLAVLPLLLGVAACNGSEMNAPESGATAGNNGEASGPEFTPANFAPRLIEAQAKAGTAHLDGSIDAGQAGKIELSGDLRLDSAEPAAQLTLTSALLGQGIEAIILDKTMYLKIPGLSAERPWMEMKLDTGPFAGAGLGALDTTSMLKGLEGALSLKSRGQESIDGVDTTRYQVSVDAGKALAAQGVRDLSALGLSGDKAKIEYDIWVDGEDLVRKIAMDIGSYALQMALSDYGKPVEIEAPPQSQIGDSPMLTG